MVTCMKIDKLRSHNSSQVEDKTLQGNIDNLFLKLMRVVTENNLHHLLVVSDYCKRRNFRAVHIFVHFAHGSRCAKI